MALTPRQQRFVEEYLIDLNGTQAAIRAGYSPRTANEQAARLLANVSVKVAVERGKRERSLRTKMEADEVVTRLARIVRANMRDYAAWGPGGVVLKESSELTEDEAACVAEIGETTTKDGGTIRFKLHNQLHAVELMLRHLGLLKDGMDLSGKVLVQVLRGLDESETIQPAPTPSTNGHARQPGQSRL